MPTDVPLIASGKTKLLARVTPRDLGFTPSAIWCISPAKDHRTAPYPLPQKILLGCVESFESRAKFTPPPFAAIVESGDKKCLISVKARKGQHHWNIVVFSATKRGVSVTIELEGHTAQKKAIENIKVQVFASKPGESRHELLSRGLKAQYPAAYRKPKKRQPKWWTKPIYCAFGDQVAHAFRMGSDDHRLHPVSANLQKLHERGIARLEKAGVPFGTIIIDAGWSVGDTWEVDRSKWPDLRGFIDSQHTAGRKVLLWIATWYARGVPDEYCVFENNRKITVDPTHPDYRKYLREQVTKMISNKPRCLNADGFKIDQLRRQPMEVIWNDQDPSATPYKYKRKKPFKLADKNIWGAELLYQLHKDIYKAAKTAKPDCLVNSSTVHPYFYDVIDQVRLHDIEDVPADPVAAMQARADLSRAALPHLSIDTDNWLHTDYAGWMNYTLNSYKLGVPCIFYAENFVVDPRKTATTRPIPMKDLKRIAKAWRKALKMD